MKSYYQYFKIRETADLFLQKVDKNKKKTSVSL